MNSMRMRWVLGLLLFGGWTAVVAQPVAAPSPKQGAALLKVDVLSVLAHPDDETGMASALASMALLDDKVIGNVYCTRGEGGGNMVGTHWGPSLGVLREAELRDCLSRLGIRYCFFLDQRDWAYTESMTATLRAWDRDLALERLVRYVRALRPEVILTMNPTPNPGQHGHHQSAAILATEAYLAAADPERFPNQIQREGLSAWQPRKLYYTGSLSEHSVTVSAARSVAGKPIAQIVGEALSQHRSQGFGRMLGAPWLGRPRVFTLAKSVLPFRKEASFFDGLPVGDSLPVVVAAPQRAGAASDRVTARVVPRPAIVRYQEWVRQFDVAHISAEFLPDIPVVQHQPNTVQVEVTNPTAQAVDVKLAITGPPGLQILPQSGMGRAEPGTTRMLYYVVPAELGDHEVEVRLSLGGEESITKARLHTVPVATIRSVRSIPSLNAGPDAWGEATRLEIAPTQRVQGQVDGAEDSSAVVHVAYTKTDLVVDVWVRDEQVVSNIAPNDVRGHWRSDSVEICVDPVAGSEDSFSCFKLGVFPFVGEEAQPGGARDADARQGPVAETAPGTRVASRRVEGGYQVRAVIPFEEIGMPNRGDREIGFNVIVYDGDKADAKPGENINQSRIAWAPRSGVQGRPEDWGRLLLR